MAVDKRCPINGHPTRRHWIADWVHFTQLRLEAQSDVQGGFKFNGGDPIDHSHSALQRAADHLSPAKRLDTNRKVQK